ncbi:STAS domain-containing protein [bacterium]|nr:STAS domain-containing protein [bacterium]
MKFLSYARRMRGQTAFVYGGKALDMDLEGGLEEVLDDLIDQGARRIVLTLGSMKFLHYTLFAGLLAVQRRLQELGGDLVLAEVPWFVEMRFQQLGVAHRFAMVPHAGVVERAERLTLNLDDQDSIIPG